MIEQSFSELGALTFWAIAILSLKGILLTGGIWVLLRFCRIEDAATRHSFWVTALLGVLLLAPLALVLPWFEIPVTEWALTPQSSSPLSHPREEVRPGDVMDPLPKVDRNEPVEATDTLRAQGFAVSSTSRRAANWVPGLAAIPVLLGYLYWVGVLVGLVRFVAVLKARRRLLESCQSLESSSLVHCPISSRC